MVGMYRNDAYKDSFKGPTGISLKGQYNKCFAMPCPLYASLCHSLADHGVVAEASHRLYRLCRVPQYHFRGGWRSERKQGIIITSAKSH